MSSRSEALACSKDPEIPVCLTAQAGYRSAAFDAASLQNDLSICRIDI